MDFLESYVNLYMQDFFFLSNCLPENVTTKLITRIPKKYDNMIKNDDKNWLHSRESI